MHKVILTLLLMSAALFAVGITSVANAERVERAASPPLPSTPLEPVTTPVDVERPPQKPTPQPKPKPCVPCHNGEGYDCENGCRV